MIFYAENHGYKPTKHVRFTVQKSKQVVIKEIVLTCPKPEFQNA